MAKYDIENILIHKPPMVLISEISNVDFEAKTLTAIVNITPKDVFYNKNLNGVPAYVGLEYMAQAIGCYAGIGHADTTPKIGFVLGSRLYKNHIEYFQNNESYTVKIHENFFEDEIGSFSCTITDKNNTLCAEGTITVFQPTDIEKFLKEKQQ